MQLLRLIVFEYTLSMEEPTSRMLDKEARDYYGQLKSVLFRDRRDLAARVDPSKPMRSHNMCSCLDLRVPFTFQSFCVAARVGKL